MGKRTMWLLIPSLLLVFCLSNSKPESVVIVSCRLMEETMPVVSQTRSQGGGQAKGYEDFEDDENSDNQSYLINLWN